MAKKTDETSNEISVKIDSLGSEYSLTDADQSKSCVLYCNDTDKNESEITITNVYGILSNSKASDNNVIRRNMKLNKCNLMVIDLLPSDIYSTIMNMTNSQLVFFNKDKVINVCIDCNDRILNDSSKPTIVDKNEAIVELMKLKTELLS